MMETKLTPQQREAIRAQNGQPVTVVDEASNERYFIIAEPVLRQLQELAAGSDHDRREHLRQLIEEGVDSQAVPADDAFARLRATAQRLAGQSQ